MVSKFKGSEMRYGRSTSHGTPVKKEYKVVTRDGNVIKGPKFERMILALIH